MKAKIAWKIDRIVIKNEERVKEIIIVEQHEKQRNTMVDVNKNNASEKFAKKVTSEIMNREVERKWFVVSSYWTIFELSTSSLQRVFWARVCLSWIKSLLRSGELQSQSQKRYVDDFIQDTQTLPKQE